MLDFNGRLGDGAGFVKWYSGDNAELAVANYETTKEERCKVTYELADVSWLVDGAIKEQLVFFKELRRGRKFTCVNQLRRYDVAGACGFVCE